ncbi:MAG TPA: PPC domain-containing protein, partial [Kofleriaceae bacterium]
TLRASYEKQAIGTRLENGVPLTVSGWAGTWQHFYVTFPPGATEQIVRTSGGTGDADLYASFGAANVPTLSAYHKRSAWGDNSEFVSVVAGDPTSGTWQIALYGMRPYSNVTIVASYTPDPGTLALSSGVPSPSFIGNTGSRRMFSIDVPQGAQNLRFKLQVPTGSADMFIKRGVAPTLTSYSHYGSLYQGVSTVTPTYTDLPGTWYVMVRGKTSYEGATLTATFDSPTPPRVLANNVPITGLAGSYGTEHRFVIDVPPGASNLAFTTAGTGDSDVFARFGAPPTISLYDKRASSFSANETITLPAATAGRWHVMVRGYAAFSAVQLVGRYDLMQD